MRVIALVDGEHYPSVTRAGIEAAGARGFDVVAAWLVGGSEKLGSGASLDLGPIPIECTSTASSDMEVMERLIRTNAPEAVLDLSDDPVLSNERRMRLVAVALRRGVAYLTPDTSFEPPITEPPLPVPTLAVIGTGKRTGKTAVSAHLARVAAAANARPFVVAMGRGGPAQPTLVDPAEVDVHALLARADRGEHAASDYLEDAVIAGVPTVGARRVGGGPMGRPFDTNVAEAAALAVTHGAGTVILEGSGASMPTVSWDAGILVAPASLRAADLTGYGGPLRVLLSDLIVFMLGVGPDSGPDDLSTLTSHAGRLAPYTPVVVAGLQPTALGDVKDKDAFFATTARGEAAVRLAEHLERTAGCRVVRTSSHLADRTGLEEDLRTAPGFDVLLTELKAAAIDVAARSAMERGAQVVFVDNRPFAAGDTGGDLDDRFRDVLRLGIGRAAERGAPAGHRVEAPVRGSIGEP